jgi:hypothetical protein
MMLRTVGTIRAGVGRAVGRRQRPGRGGYELGAAPLGARLPQSALVAMMGITVSLTISRLTLRPLAHVRRIVAALGEGKRVGALD